MRQSTARRARHVFAAAFVIATAVVASFAPTAHAGGRDGMPIAKPPTVESTTDRYIVKFRDQSADPKGKLPALSSTMGGTVTYVRAMSGGAHVVRIDRSLSMSLATGLARDAMADPGIQYIHPDRKMYPLAVPNDSMYSSQWNLYEAIGGINAPAAWDITTGSSSVVIGVIDTGYRPHADLAAKILPGYDFITDTTVSVDGDGRDADASDPGDYGCEFGGGNSTWHGTHVSGIAGAVTNNGTGIAGVNWVSKILPLRVLGRCGGYTSDIVDAMRWGAGIPVSGVPNNPTPARVLNLSLGGTGSCESATQSAINDVVALGTVVVVAAGNSNSDASGYDPASCANVIVVGATTRNGGRAYYSNFGSNLTLSAPGTGVLSTLNSGATTPQGDNYVYYNGTSMATPHVAGVVSLMLSQNPSMTPAQVKAKLIASARTFPTGTGADCTTALCGAGIVDAAAALTTTTTAPRVNLAAASVGAVASASSTYSSAFPVASVNNGDRTGAGWGAGGGWNDATVDGFPDSVQIDFPGARTIGEIDVFTLQDNWPNPVAPTESMTFTQYGITAFDVQYWNGSTWVTVPGGSVTGNNKVWSKFAFTPVTTTSIRVRVNGALASYSRIVEIEAYGDSPPLNVAKPENGGSVSASSTYSNGFPATSAIDGDRRGLGWGSGTGGWNDGTVDAYPDALQVNFSQTRRIGEIDVFTLQDNFTNPIDPTLGTTFSLYGIVDFDVQYWDGATWVTIPGGGVTGNNKVWRQFTFTPVSTNAIRIVVRNALASWSRIVEVEAYLAN